MASETSQNVRELQARVRESTDRAELLNEEAEARLALIEDSRDVIHKLAKSIDLVLNVPAGEEVEGLESIETCIDHLNLVKNVLREEDKNYKLVQKRVQVAFKLARKYQYMLTEAQRELVDAIVQEEEEEEEDKKNPNYVSWYPEQVPATMATPPKDQKAQQYYNTLDDHDKSVFDKLHRYFFYKGFVKHKPDDYSGERKKFEILVTARMSYLASLSLQKGAFELTPEIYKDLRASALKMVEEEQMKAIGPEKEKQIRLGEFQRRKSVHKWVQEQKKLSPKRPKLTTIINKNKSLAISCNPILTDYYENLKHKHLRNTNCKTFMKRILARPTIPNYADQILTIQLKDLLQNKNVQ